MGVKLKDWLALKQSDDDTRELFYHMSKTLRYIHEKGYCAKTFNLNEIEILNLETLNPIQYNTVVKMPEESSTEIRHEDNYNLAFMQIGIYTGMLNVLRPEFLKEQFDSFVPLLPEEDVPYLRGVIVRGANVYYCDYIEEKNKREIEKLQQESENDANSNSKVSSFQKAKSTATGRAMVDKETKKLYSPIDKPEAAFISLLIFPLIMVLAGIIFSIMLLFS